MLNISEYLKTELEKIHKRVYRGRAHKSAIFPYVVFGLPSSTVPETDSELVTLEINIWDYSRDGYDATENIEILTDRIEEFLTFNRQIDEEYFMMFAKTNRLDVRDPNQDIQRRQLRYTIKYYKK